MPRQDHPLRLPTLVFAGAAAADWTTTYRNLAPYGHEANPLLAPFHDRPLPTVLAGAALDGVAVWAWDRYVGRTHPKLATVGLYVAAGFRVWMASRNAYRLNHLAQPDASACGAVFCRN